jgi:hypothetical protein
MPHPKSTYNTSAASDHVILTQDAAPPMPPGRVGPLALPGSGRIVWWTGRVAIGLRHQPTLEFGPLTQPASWVQSVLLDGARCALAGG